MLVSVVSDVHGNIEDLARVAEQAEFLIVLGDLLEYVDYHSPEDGILGAVFGADAVAAFASFRVPGFRSWLSGLGAWMPVWARELGSQRAGSRVSRRFGVLGGRFGAVQAGVAGWMLV